MTHHDSWSLYESRAFKAAESHVILGGAPQTPACLVRGLPPAIKTRLHATTAACLR